MLHYAIVFLIIALIAAVFGFGGIAAGAAGDREDSVVIFLIGAVRFFHHAQRTAHLRDRRASLATPRELSGAPAILFRRRASTLSPWRTRQRQFSGPGFETPAMSKGSDLLVAALENEGVERIFGVPGRREPRRRRVAAQIAASSSSSPATSKRRHSWPQLTGASPAAPVCACRPWAGRAQPHDRRGLCAAGRHAHAHVTGQKPIKNPRQARFQMVDIVGTMRPLTKTDADKSSRPPPFLRWCATHSAWPWRSARVPVHLELPEDIAAEEADAPLVPAHPIDWPIASPHAVARVAGVIRAARKPLIMIGAAGNRAAPRRSFVGFRTAGASHCSIRRWARVR